MNGLSTREPAKSLVELGGVINKLRVLQGFNMLGPKETAPLAVIWAEQLDRFNISPRLYDRLLNDCVDFRRRALLDGKEFIPGFSVELFLAMFDRYKQKEMESSSNLRRKIYRIEQELEMAERVLIGPDGEEFPQPTFPEEVALWKSQLQGLQGALDEWKVKSFLFEGE